MMRFVNSPNLPEGRVKTVICGELSDELNDFLDSRDIERIVIAPNKYIDPATENHVDMAAVHIGKNKVAIDKNQIILISTLKEKGFTVYDSQNEIKGEYPKDVALNFAIIGDYILGNFSYADSALTLGTTSLKKISVRQGYCKCSCLIINENALITDDMSIHENAARNGIDCLLISKGDVSLPGHEYGFIGGASGKISKSDVLFFGDITKHKDYKKIADFIEKHGCNIISLDFPLTDFGGIIPVIEETP
ncbi:MAG: hypothetical protein IJW86_02310 [Clostridia bacterium]|nr:hypothetical protein [Clostridia bacterium]